ncbi:hypothetical protein OPFAMLBM_00251 [Aeromonas phage avDM12-TAAL]|nr:hypothetical protein OPFAMLBM_00251 [Aeromonas phage avDM12-TAAL]
MFEILYILILGHFVADYVLQSDSIARGKNPINSPLYGVHWFYWLTAHSATHALVVYVATKSVWLSLAELVSHWIIDYAKCNSKIGLHQDQALHIVCKILIAIAYFCLTGNPESL